MRAEADVRPAVTSPITGWTREHWADLADRMLRAVRPYASPAQARVTLPGAPGGFGREVDGLEGFARTFLLAGFRLAGEDGSDPPGCPGLTDRYADGIAAGTNPSSPERWVRMDEHPQAKVEAASIALILDLTRPWIWDRLSSAVRERVVDYLSPVVGDHTYPRCNWVWFRVVVETFLRSVGGPWSEDDIESDLAAHESFYRADGWYADGEERSFDHYTGWAMHLYPVLWARMRGPSGERGVLDLAAGRHGTDVRRLDRFLLDYVRLIGADGSPLVQGRSLTYRFAAAAALWAGALAGVSSTGPGQLRRAASGVVRHFTEHGAPDHRDLLTLGWHHEWPRIAQSYSGPSSPYWAAKGMLGLSLPADHPVWTAVEEPLPVEHADDAWVARAPGWLVSGTRSDGVVRVVNHGTDHATVGAPVSDSPLYARLGYSTATAPLMSPAAWESPVDQTVALLDVDGNATHRAGMHTIRTGVVGEGPARAAVGASVARAHWVVPTEEQRDHGSGRAGSARDAAAITVVSVLRGAWEVRCVRIDPLAHAPEALGSGARLRVGGWPLSLPEGDAGPSDRGRPTACARQSVSHGPESARAWSEQGISVVVASGGGFDDAGVHSEDDASPLGAYSSVPWVSGPVVPGWWYAVAVGLQGRRDWAELQQTPAVELDDRGELARVVWPDSVRTEVDLPRSPADGVPLR